MGQFNTRIQHKHDTEANWIRASRATNPFIPLLGEIIFYDADDNYHYTRMKIGDGEKTVDALPFIDAQTFDENGVIKQNALPEGYPYVTSGEVLPMTSVSFDPNSGQGMIVDKFSLAKDAEYEVIWNGTSYTCTGVEYYLDSLLLICVGDLAVFEGIEPTDYPFLVARIADDATAEVEGAYGMVISYEGLTDVNLSIKGTVVKKIDNEYLDLAWLPTIVDGYSDGELLGEIYRSTQNDNDIEGLTFDNIIEGQTYIVDYNDTRYIQVARETLYDGIPIRYLGNLSLSGLEGTANTGEPFIVSIVNYSGTIIASVNDKDSSPSFVLSVYTAVPAPEYNKIPKGFLPSSVATKFDIKGLASEEYVKAQISTKPGKTVGMGAEIFNSDRNEATGNYSHAEGDNTKADGYCSHAEGDNTKASGYYSHAEGTNTTASGLGSRAEGSYTTASGWYSHAEGFDTTASGKASHAEGYDTTASGDCQHVQGKYSLTRTSEAANNYAHIVGGGTDVIDRKDIHTLDWSGNAWFAGDVYVGSTSGKDKDAGSKKLITETDLASLTASDVGALPDTTVIPSIDGLATEEYVNTQVSTKPGKFDTGSKAEIFNDLTSNQASNYYSHAEGSMTTASGYASHAEGADTTASGNYSHAEGADTTASGNYSHAEGADTTASGQDSHAEGQHTIASGMGAHAEGVVSAFSINLTGEANATEYVCSGHHQAYCKVDSYFKVNGSIIFITNVSKNNNITTITVSNTLSAEAITDKEYTVYRGIAKGYNSHTEGQNTTTSGSCAHAEGNITTASGYASHAEGDGTTATGQSSHAEGNYTTASGNYSHAEGSSTTASGRGSHAEGNQTTASGEFSHAEGSYTTASGTRSHAEGWGADASGDQSHAEGNYTAASGRGSHAEGGYTEAYGDYQHVQGKHNLTRTLEAANNYAHIVGAGAAANDRKDIHTLDWNGNAWFAGNVYVGSTSGRDKDAGSKKLITETELASLIAQITEAVSKKSQIQLITWEADD